ncbi:MAG TPA: DUF5007 domain-containing protein [Arachidicoccus sp.]|nr:DUF5007 domain-containing protein [Arachidicoccus sp.]
MRIRFKTFFALVTAGSLVVSCSKLLPHDRDSIADDSNFTQDSYMPILGRSTLYNTFVAGSSTQPLTFKIINPRTKSGDPAPELTDVFPVKVWKEAYTGQETSFDEIEKKRGTEMHHLFEIREHSGQFLIWPEAKSTFIHAQPDSGYVFDVEMSNSGGRRFFRNMRLKPFREIPYEPSNLDPITGQAKYAGVSPTRIVNIVGEHTDQILFSNDIIVFFNKVGGGNSLKFEFLDTLQNPINPDKFNLTDWKHLVHGFNMTKTATNVTYQVAYPIPLTNVQTQYTTTDGLKAHTIISWARQGFGDNRIVAELGLDFSIFEKGDWEIKFWFRRDNPKFAND